MANDQHTQHAAPEKQRAGGSAQHGQDHNPYARLALMALLSFAAMFVLMYAMVDVVANAVPNINQAYMAALMAAPMVLIELALMGRMYQSRKWNAVTIGASLIVFVLSFLAIRDQTAVGDAQFVRSMIPHHASAVLMCEKAPVTDAEIQRLCQGIISSQQAEIAQMRAIQRRLEG
jgi:uncharacterized protein (DUF305 family)